MYAEKGADYFVMDPKHLANAFMARILFTLHAEHGYCIGPPMTGGVASRSTRWTVWRRSLLLRTRLLKYLLAPSVSVLTLLVSSFLSWSFSTFLCRPIRTSLAGPLSARRTSELIRSAFEWV
jgi:hypothetical protein